VLQFSPFDAVEAKLNNRGYRSEERSGRSFFHRRVASAFEKHQVDEKLRGRGVEPAGKEADGQLLAASYLSPIRNAVKQVD